MSAALWASKLTRRPRLYLLFAFPATPLRRALVRIAPAVVHLAESLGEAFDVSAAAKEQRRQREQQNYPHMSTPTLLLAL